MGLSQDSLTPTELQLFRANTAEVTCLLYKLLISQVKGLEWSWAPSHAQSRTEPEPKRGSRRLMAQKHHHTPTLSAPPPHVPKDTGSHVHYFPDYNILQTRLRNSTTSTGSSFLKEKII